MLVSLMVGKSCKNLKFAGPIDFADSSKEGGILTEKVHQDNDVIIAE